MRRVLKVFLAGALAMAGTAGAETLSTKSRTSLFKSQLSVHFF